MKSRRAKNQKNRCERYGIKTNASKTSYANVWRTINVNQGQPTAKHRSVIRKREKAQSNTTKVNMKKYIRAVTCVPDRVAVYVPEGVSNLEYLKRLNA